MANGSCIVPAELGGGKAQSLSSSTGYGGSPSSTTIRYVSPSGSFGDVPLSLNSPMNVGTSNSTRKMVPVKYSIDQSVGGSVMSVTFQDYNILEMQRKFVVMKDPDVNIPGGACVRPMGQTYHKPPGAPNKVDETTLRRGSAPKIKIGGVEKNFRSKLYFLYRFRISGLCFPLYWRRIEQFNFFIRGFDE